MTVPALTTADIATFAYWRQTSCAYVQLADVLSILHSYQQFAEYVDGTIKIFDTGSESAAPNNYVLVNVRIRADGWIMAWFPRTLMTGTANSGSGVVVTDNVMEITRNGATSAGAVMANELAGYVFKPTSGPLSGNEYTIKSNTTTTITLHDKYGDDVSTDVDTLGAATYDILQSRGNIAWWGHTSSAIGNPTSQSTRFGRALYEMWEALKTNQQGGSGAVLSYSDVGYWDYEYTSATHLYIFGDSRDTSDEKFFYMSVPSAVTIYDHVINYGVYAWSISQPGRYADIELDFDATHYLDINVTWTATHTSSGYRNLKKTGIQVGVRHTYRSYGDHVEGGVRRSVAIVLLTSG